MIRFPRFILLAGLIGGTLIAGAAQAESRIVPVEVSSSSRTSTISGTVVPYKEVTLTAQLPGRVEQVTGVEGSSKLTGDLLVSIDVDDLVARRQQVQAQMANANAALQNAQVQYNRELYSPRSESLTVMPGMGMPSMFDQMFTRNMGDAMGFGDTDAERHADLYSAMTAVNQARSAVMQAQSQLQELDTRIMDARAVAPFDGVILKKMVEVGDTVQPGQPLVSFGHVSYLRLQAEVPTSLVGSLQVGQTISAKLDNGLIANARVAQIFPVADAVKHTVTVKFDLPQGINVAPGVYAEISIPVQLRTQRKQVIIPESALIPGRSLPSVLVVSERNGSMMKLVRLGQKLANGRVVVLSGLSSADQIIDNPPAGVKSGWLPGS